MSHWYLAPCSVPVSPEEHWKIWSFLGDAYAEFSLRPLVSGSHLCCVFYDPTVSCSEFAFEYKSMGFSGRRILVWFPYSVLLGSTLDTCMASVCEASWLHTAENCGYIHVFTQMLFPMVLIVQKTIEIPQLLVDTMADVPFVLVV